VPWIEILGAFVVSHAAGDYLLQTQWQAANKYGGLTNAPESRRALASHVVTYGIAFIPALLWMLDSLGAGVLAVAALILLPHFIQDDGRLVSRYIATVKRAHVNPGDPLFVAVDQSFHLIALFLVAVVAAG
jgi:hypothetical protein